MVCCSVAKLCLTLRAPWTAAQQASLSLTIWSLLKFMSIELVMRSNHLILCRPLLLPSIFPSIGVFSNESALCIRWLSTGASASASVLSINKYLGLISCKIDWFDFFAIQGTLRSLLQHHSLKASVLQHSAFFMVQLSRYVIAFLPKSKQLLICGCSHCLQWFRSPRNRVYHCFHFFPHIFAMKWWDWRLLS